MGNMSLFIKGMGVGGGVGKENKKEESIWKGEGGSKGSRRGICARCDFRNKMKMQVGGEG